MAIKARVVQMKMDLDDQRKAARLLGGAIGKEITARRREIDELKERGATLVRNASNQHHSMLFKHLGQVEGLVHAKKQLSINCRELNSKAKAYVASESGTYNCVLLMNWILRLMNMR